MDNTTYEFFIRRAWKCERFKKGANTDTWGNLLVNKINYEDSIGKAHEKKKKAEYEKQFNQVKTYIDNAYSKLLTRINTVNNSDLVNVILDLQKKAINSTSPDELFKVLSDSLKTLNDNNL